MGKPSISKTERPRFTNHAACDIISSLVNSNILAGGPGRRLRRYPPQSLEWEADDVANRIFILRRGRIQLTSLRPDGREFLVRSIQSGEIFGELCFCAHQNEPMGTFARALTQSEVIGIGFDEFRGFIQRDQRLITYVLSTVCQRLFDAERRNQILGCHGARERLERLLLHLASLRNRRHSRLTWVSLTISHAELAALAAMTRPHVSLLMARLRRQGLIAYERGSPLNVNAAKLRGRLDSTGRQGSTSSR